MGGAENVFAWVDDRFEVPAVNQIAPNWQEIQAGWTIIEHVYLSPYSSAARRSQLQEIQRRVRQLEDRPVVVLGDFNLAPSLDDGKNGERHSRWTSTAERFAFNSLLESCSLIDSTSVARVGHQQYTFERTQQGNRIAFRCDLALVTDYVADDFSAEYRHETRSGACRFTDHSALVIDLPVTLPTTESVGLAGHSVEEVYPHKTAISRVKPSKAAQELSKVIPGLSIQSVLDFGCGHGTDVDFYRSLRYEAFGYDPYTPFGFPALPDAVFDLVTVVFVLNVLADPQERINAVRIAASRVRSGGMLFLAARSPETINKQSQAKHWPVYNDGFLSDARKRTFQKGISKQEMLSLISRLGFEEICCPIRLSSDTTCVLARRIKG